MCECRWVSTGENAYTYTDLVAYPPKQVEARRSRAVWRVAFPLNEIIASVTDFFFLRDCIVHNYLRENDLSASFLALACRADPRVSFLCHQIGWQEAHSYVKHKNDISSNLQLLSLWPIWFLFSERKVTKHGVTALTEKCSIFKIMFFRVGPRVFL